MLPNMPLYNMRKRFLLVALLLALIVAGVVGYFLLRGDPGDSRLNTFVHNRPPVPIVFTSRTEPMSFFAAAPSGDGFAYPGQRLWAAREGRLRLLTTAGTVHELTRGKPLPNGGTLIDVMSPSISLDGKRIYFAGRKGGDDPGRFRLYVVDLDGSNLRPLTGGPHDEGCVALPPLRRYADGSPLSEEERKRIDFDDSDPIELPFSPRRIAFASSRTPDLGRDHTRRSTTIWIQHEDGTRYPLSDNRNNDRWPFMLHSGFLTFSLWSRNREVVTADGRDIVPFQTGMATATAPIDQWQAVIQQPAGPHFGMLVKPSIPVWRPRPLFNGRIAYMTTFAVPDSYAVGDELPPLIIVQSPTGTVASAPSASPAGTKLPTPGSTIIYRGPEKDEQGRRLWCGTPSPCPPREVVFSAAALEEVEKTPAPGRFGLYLASDDWPSDVVATIQQINMRLLFDDPEMVDAEPVAVYARDIPTIPSRTSNPTMDPVGEYRTAAGRLIRGPQGMIFASAMTDAVMNELPGQITDADTQPIFAPPAHGSIDHLRVWAAHRDRFDDPSQDRILGTWEYLGKVPVKDGQAIGRIPVGSPVVLAGFDRGDHIVQWTTPARDAQGHQATFYAYAGDHYSLVKPTGRPFCTGCHPGHSGLPASNLDQHRERMK